MKKIFLALLMMSFLCTTVDAQNKVLQKALQKEYKSKMKEFSKEGWKIFGSSRSLDVALLKHYDKLNQDDCYEIVGVAGSFKSKNLGMQIAINNACNKYATKASSVVKGRVVSDMASQSEDVSAEFDRFYAAYERLVEKEIKGELHESFSVLRDNGNGTFEMQTYFIVNEESASKVRIRALENAAKESEAAQKYAETVSKFIKEGFDPSED